MAAAAALEVLLIVIFVIVGTAEGRYLVLNSDDHNLISDGADHHVEVSGSTCNHEYGFLPCAENAFGYLFQIVVYQGLLMVGERQMDIGSKVLFDISKGRGESDTPGAKDIWGVVFGILMSLPSMVLMIASVVSSSHEEAQSTVSMVVGIFAGITVFKLTVQWSLCVIYGSRNLKSETHEHTEAQAQALAQALAQAESQRQPAQPEPEPQPEVSLGLTGYEPEPEPQPQPKPEVLSGLTGYLPHRKKLRIIKEGVSTDDATRSAAGIVVLSLIPYVVVQFLNVSDASSKNRIRTLIALIVSSLSLISYFIYQVLNPLVQQRSLEYTRYEILQAVFMKQAQRLFSAIDENADNQITKDEMLRHVHKSIIKKKMQDDEDTVNSDTLKLFKFSDSNPTITKEELIATLKNFINESDGYSAASKRIFYDLFLQFNQEKKDNPQKIHQDTFQTSEGEQLLRKILEIIASVIRLVAGILIITFLGGPLTANILQLSNAMNFPSFIIGFIILPLTNNIRAAITAILPASKKKERTDNLTFSEIYGGVIMNNISGLTTLLAIIYAKDLTWDFSAEVFIIMLVCVVMGSFASSRTTYHLWTCIIAVLLYPFSLGLYYFVRVMNKN